MIHFMDIIVDFVCMSLTEINNNISVSTIKSSSETTHVNAIDVMYI